MKKKLALSALLALSAFPLSAEQIPTGAAFLKIPIGARAMGLGGAYTALGQDASAMAWNPSGLAGIKRVDIVAAHNQWIAGTQVSFAGYGQRLFGAVAIGVNYLTFNAGSLERRDAQGKRLGDFNAQDKALGVSLALSLGPNIAVGGTAKRIEQRLDEAKAEGQALDIGAQIKMHRKLTVGACLRHLGPQMKFVNEPYALPATLSAGIALHLSPSLSVAAEGRTEQSDPSKKTDFAVGLEYNLLELKRSYFWAPVTWRLGFLAPNQPGAGVGLKILGSQVDYAIANFEDLGITHRLSLRLSF